MEKHLNLSPAPELFFGLVAPIGVDLDLVTEVLSQLLNEMNYDSYLLRLTKLMREVPTEIEISDSPYVRSFKDRIRYANKVRSLLGNDALAALAISAIRASRSEEWEKRSLESKQMGSIDQTANHDLEHGSPQSTSSDPRKSPEEIPLSNQAYILRQFKRREEIDLLRGVYGRQFIVISAYSPQYARCKRIEEQERRSRGGLISEVDAHNLAYELVAQDAEETLEPHGQNVRDAFPLGDVFIDATSRETCELTLRNFIYLFFGDNHITPSHDEYGMYMAKSASLRSSDLSRQVGAAIFRTSGEVITLGCNEVPKAGGGTYWSGDSLDKRDFVAGFDPNEQHKIELLVDILDRLRNGEHLSEPRAVQFCRHERGTIAIRA